MGRFVRGTGLSVAFFLLGACSGDPTPSSGDAPLTDTIDFLGSTPSAGSRVVVEGCGGTCTDTLVLDFRTVLRSTVMHAELFVELFGESRQRCATGSTSLPAMTAGAATNASVRSLFVEPGCSLPTRLTSVKATLRDDQTWRSYVEKSFTSDLSLESAVSSSLDPAVVRMTWWDNETHGASPPRAGGSASIECLVEEHERSGVVLTVTLENAAGGWIWINEDDGSKPTTLQSPCVDEPHLFKIGFRAGGPTRAVVTCSAVSGRGRRTTPRSITIPVCCS